MNAPELALAGQLWPARCQGGVRLKLHAGAGLSLSALKLAPGALRAAMTAAADAEMQGDFDTASRYVGAAINLTDAAGDWAEYARLLLAIWQSPNVSAA